MNDRDAFYRELTSRNAGLIPAEVQKAIRDCRVLIAGCGSTGGAAVEPLVRLGVERFVLAEPDRYELSNLNRQSASVSDVGRNKAVVAAERITGVNRYAAVEVVDEGVTAANAPRLVGDCGFVVDGVDVTTKNGWLAKLELHRRAAELGVPTLSGYDLGSTQYTCFYDYRRGPREPLGGRVDLAADTLEPFALLARIIPPGFVSKELIAAVSSAEGSEFSVPQLVDTAGLFGLIAARVLARSLSGLPVAAEIALDLDRLTGTEAVPPEPDAAVAAWFGSMSAQST